MAQRRHRIDFSLLRRRQHSSITSSTSLSPTVPVLESPVTFQALISQKDVSDTTLKQSNKMNRTPVTPSMFFEEKEDEDASVSRLNRATFTDGRTARVTHKSSIEEEPLQKTKTRYFEDVFSTRGPSVSPRTRINRDSLVVIEIKVNIRIKNEDALVSSILSRMARIYQKPENLIMITLQQDACLRLGSSLLPAYLIKIFALPCLIAPITNLRSTILIQSALQQVFHIAPNRGVILYIPMAEENMATNNMTMMGEISHVERESQAQEPRILRSLSRSMTRKKKSTSSQSIPLSEATTTSWTVESNGPDTKAPSTGESQSSDASVGESRSRLSRSSNTLRHFVSRHRFQDRRGQTDEAE